jgi:hypothetical protein
MEAPLIRNMIFFCFFAPFLLAIEPLADLEKSGVVTFGGQEFHSWVFDKDYRGTRLGSQVVQVDRYLKTNGVVSWAGTVTLGEMKLSLSKILRPGETGCFDYEEVLSPVSDLAAKEISLGAKLEAEEYSGRRLWLDGDPLELPVEKSSRPGLARKDSFRGVLLPFSGFRLGAEGNGGIVVQDDRHFGTKSFDVRFSFFRNGEKAILKLKISRQNYEGLTLPIGKIANRALKDDSGEGWTGQGPANDLRSFPLGMGRWGGLPYRVGDPAAHGNPAALVLGGTPRSKDFPKASSLTLAGLRAAHLSLLHAVAWAPLGRPTIGTVTVHYQDETSQSHGMVLGRDVADWFSAARLPNGVIAWSGTNATANIGLYASTFPLMDKPVARIDFQSASNCIWMVVGATLADEIPARPPPQPFIFKETPEWKPVVLPRRVEKGSALDFSFLQDAPAGKYGKVVSRAGHFYFETKPEKPVRFFGGNLMPGCLVDRAASQSYADRLEECGYNAVRLHMYDIMLVAGRSNSLDVAPDRMNRLDEVVDILAQKGIYHTLDLFCWRVMRANEVPEWGRRIDEMQDYKALMFLLDPVRENFKAFSRKLLTHVNPRTGKRWADHPALISINLVNEGKMTRMGSSREVKALYQERFSAWLAQRGEANLDANRRANLFARFLEERYRLTMDDVRKDLEKLGLRVPLSDQNDGFDFLHTFLVQPYDYVDNHYYFDWPSMAGPNDAFPHLIHNRSEVSLWAPPLAACFPTRALGKPFTISEFSTGYPNQTRASSGILAASYGALQDWDALYRFLPDSLREGPIRTWETALDPVNLLSDRLAALLFLRGDVKPSELEIPLVFPASFFAGGQSNGEFPASIRRLGFVGRMGSAIASPGWTPQCQAAVTFGPVDLPRSVRNWPADATETRAVGGIDLSSFGKIGKGLLDEAARRSVSSTGELDFDAGRGVFKLVTPRTEVVISHDAGVWSGEVLTVSNQGGFGVFAITALDGKSLDRSGRMLIFHITQVVNNGLRFSGPGLTSVEFHGVLPLLLKKGIADFSIRLGGVSSPPKVFALDLSGKRTGEKPFILGKNGNLSFKGETIGGTQSCMLYEIAR